MFSRGKKCLATATRKLSAISLTVLSLTLAACVTVVEKPATQALLYTTRAGDTVTLSWATKPGEKYAVHYADSRSGGAKWTVLPGCEHVVGTGKPVEKTDHVPFGQDRFYRLIVVPAK